MKSVLVTIFTVFGIQLATAQNELPKMDTVKISITSAEDRFVNKSLYLVAARYDIDIAKSGVLQSKAWVNPTISYSQELYDPARKVYLDNNSKSGQMDIQLSQLISIAGKYTNSVKLAKLAAEKSEYAFNDVLRGLKYDLYNNYTSLVVDQQKLKLYQYQIGNLNQIINATEQELKLGAIPGNDLIRLKTERQNLQNLVLDVISDFNGIQSELKILLNYPANTFLVADETYQVSTPTPAYASILETAQKNRPDLLLAGKEINYQQQNLKLQKSSAVPDVTLGGEYDKAGSVIPNFYGIGASMDLPVLNRNKGNIHIARYQLKQATVLDSLQQNTVDNEVTNAYLNLLATKKQLDNSGGAYVKDLDTLISNATQNYGKRLISILEYLDQLRTYVDAKSDLIDLNMDYLKAVQTINYTTGITLIK